MNFGETLVYWYLRLNGFFPLQNFVLHMGAADLELKGSADSDLLAIRHRHTYENIGGVDKDWDHEVFEEWGVDLRRHQIGLIVEVKTSPYPDKIREGIGKAFEVNRLIYAIQRLGFYPQEQAHKIAANLIASPHYIDEENNIVIAKVLAATVFPAMANGPHYHPLHLRAIVKFIRARMRKYRRVKVADRMFFPDDLLQYLIWDSDKPD